MTSFKSRVQFCLLFVLLISLSAASVFAQTVTGTISGTVKDSSGAVLPGAQVEVLNQDTGIARTFQTDAGGHYSALLLPLGTYSITTTAQGFQKEVRSGIVLTVGREAVVDVAMAVGAMTQTVEVQGEAAIINTTSATLQGLVAGEQIRELPLNGRSYNDLALLNPGVIYDRTTGSSSSDGYGVRMSINGGRANQNLFLIDGTVTNDATQTAGTVNAQSLGVEGIREFAVLTHNYNAEFGHSAGGIVNAVTRSGTNQLHGSLYEYFRNSALDARDFFQQGPIAPFRRNQFGGSIGGRLKKDKIFFFGNYEGFRQSLAVPSSGNVPNAQARLGKIPTTAAACPSSIGTYSGGICSMTVNPLMVPYLTAYALPNGPDNGDGTAKWTYGFKQAIPEDYYMERVDFHLSDKDNLYARYIYDQSTRTRPGADPRWTTLDAASNYFSQIGETHIFTPNAINDFRAAFNRTDRHTAIGPQDPAVDILDSPANTFVPGQPIGRINFSNSSSGANSSGGGLVVLGNLNATPAGGVQNLFEESDTFTWVHSKHSFKFGGDLERYQFNTISGGGVRGSWIWSGLQTFILGRPDNLDAGKILGATSIGTVSVQNFGWRNWLPAWFVQDDWRVTSRLTLNLGLRHEFFTDPMEVNGLMARLVNLTDATSTLGTPYNGAKMNFAPRFGLAWDPTGSGKTAIRFGLGTYFNQITLKESGPPSDYRFSATYTLTCNWTGVGANPCATFPKVPANPPLSTSKSDTFIQSPLATPTVTQYGLDVQRQISTAWSLRVGYVGWYGFNLTRSYCGNCLIPNPATGLFVGGTKPNPAFGSIGVIAADSHANYNSLQTELKKALSAGLMLQVSYTYSKTLSESDSSSNRVTDNSGTGGYVTMIPGNQAADYARSAYDQRHLLVVNSQYELPFGKSFKGVPKTLLAGWTVNGIWQYGSGLPLNVSVGSNQSKNGDPNTPDRPNLRPGFSNSPDSGVTAGCGGTSANPTIPVGQALGTANRWYDPCAFTLPVAGTYGNLGKNTLNGPKYDQVNITLAKNFAFTERMKLQFRAEFFNLFNHVQFGLPALAVFDSGNYSGSAGQLSYTTVPGLGGRNIQFGLKLTF